MNGNASPDHLAAAVFGAEADAQDEGASSVTEPGQPGQPHGLSVYSQQRFLAVVAGELPAETYSDEVAQHVDTQLSRRYQRSTSDETA